MLKPETIKEIESLATEMAGIFTPPELIVGCEVLSVADRDQYAVNNGWIEARVGKHNRQRCRWRGQFANVKVADYVDVLFFASYRLFVVLNQGGTSAVTAILNNYTATAAPTVDDDSGDGYSVGSAWIDVTADKAYICLGATVGAAVWEEIGGSGLAGGVWLIHSTTITIYATITLAVADYAAGDTIMILPGTYSENFTFTSAITLIGTDRDTCIITSTATATIATRADVTLENLTIQNTGTAAQQIALHINSASSDEGTVIARRCNIVGDVNTSLGSRAVRCEAGTGHRLIECDLITDNADASSTDDEGLSIGGGEIEVHRGRIDGVDQDVQVYGIAGAKVTLYDPILANNLITITGPGTGEGQYLDAKGVLRYLNKIAPAAGDIPIWSAANARWEPGTLAQDAVKVSKIVASDGSPDAATADASGALTVPVSLALAAGVPVDDIDTIIANDDTALITSGGVYDHTNASAQVHGLPASVHVLGHRAGAGRFVQSAVGTAANTSASNYSNTYYTSLTTVTFPVAFSATPIVVAANNGTNYAGVNIDAVTTSTFKYYGWSTAASVACTPAYIAIGT